jgi:nanoRNase/pAp phosphatase (c-di-AMP/oligoRNAs hydrolase)
MNFWQLIDFQHFSYIAEKAFCIVIIHRNLPRYHFFDFSIVAKTVGSTATIIVSDGFLPQQGMHRSASTQRSLQFFEEATACTL